MGWGTGAVDRGGAALGGGGRGAVHGSSRVGGSRGSSGRGLVDRGGDRVAADGAGDGSSAGGYNDVTAGILGDTELGGVLVLAGHIIDDLDTVALGTLGSLKGGGRSPGKGAAVLDTLSNGGTELDDVVGRTLEEEDRDRVGCAWGPGDGEGLASRHNLFLG